MSIRVNPHLASLPQYVAGKRLPDTQAAKLSSNENPYPPAPSVLAAARDAVENSQRYPDLFATQLCERLGEIHGIPASRIVAGTGSTAVIGYALAAVAGRGDQVVMPWRSFEAYPILVGAVGAESVQVPLKSDGTHDIPALIAAAQGDQVRAVLLCSPNNPSSTLLTADDIRTVAAGVRPEILVLLDEAYIDFVTPFPHPTGIELLKEIPNLAVLRTFSKAYQLAGARVGYLAAASTNFAAAVRSVATPFAVNHVAQAAALAALADKDVAAYTRGTVAKIISERERVVPAVRAMGWEVPSAQGNFFFLPYPHLVTEITQVCAKNGVTVRPFPEGVRITIGIPEENDRLLDALRQIKAPAAPAAPDSHR